MIDTINSYSEEDLNKVGVYKILNLVNGKFYIGSTTQSFKKRGVQHYSDLVRGVHKNSYLKYSWNKYGEKSFKFEIVEFCESQDSLTREQYWLDFTKSYDKTIGYNINPLASGTPNMIPEVIEKRRQTMLRRYASGEITSYLKGKPAWNKGQPMTEEWKQNLRKPKTVTDTLIKSRKKKSENARNKSPKILIYNNEGNYIKTFNSSMDVYDYSLNENHDLPLVLYNKVGRNGHHPGILKNQNINNCCKGIVKHYKGLQFRYENSDLPILIISSDEILTPKCRSTKKLVDDKSDELRESLEADNTEPS